MLGILALHGTFTKTVGRNRYISVVCFLGGKLGDQNSQSSVSVKKMKTVLYQSDFGHCDGIPDSYNFGLVGSPVLYLKIVAHGFRGFSPWF